MGEIHLPDGQHINIAQPSVADQVLLKALQEFTAFLQFQYRLAVGWDPAAAIADMQLNVPMPPGKPNLRPVPGPPEPPDYTGPPMVG